MARKDIDQNPDGDHIWGRKEGNRSEKGSKTVIEVVFNFICNVF
jgi:hypothetical protein